MLRTTNYSNWTDAELEKQERRYGKHDVRAGEIRVELERRDKKRARNNEKLATLKTWIAIIGGSVSVITAFAAMMKFFFFHSQFHRHW
jgi:hypothetical protein